MENLVIGIEGLVGAGKTSIARCLLDKIPNSILLHGGNIYRAIMCGVMKRNTSINELIQQFKGKDVRNVMEELHISIELKNRETVVLINGKEIEEAELQSKQASMAVSSVSGVADNHSLYAFGNTIIQDFKNHYHVILSSRDIMKMYPEVDYHFFVTASLEERVRRKCIQYGGEEKEVKEHIQHRDALQEKTGYYQIYENTITIDATHFASPEEGAEAMMQYIKLPVQV